MTLPNTPDLHTPAAEPLVRFCYCSRAAGALSADDLRGLVFSSWRNNLQNGISGLLEYDGRRFRQVIEGDPQIVALLAATILADSRHTAIKVLEYGAVTQREHMCWTLSGFGPFIDGLPGGMTADAPDGNVIVGRFGARRGIGPAGRG